MGTQTPIQRAVNHFRTQVGLAEAIGRNQSTVWEWLRRGWPALEACAAIEEATSGKVTAAELIAPAFLSNPKKRRKNRRKQ